jgi:NAD(P)-dependent dehydrogenase (short-subunit alcohol dehydrogenase family)
MGNPVRTAVVTGAGQGIGKAVALGLLHSGWQVALLGRRLTLLEELVSSGTTDPSQAVAIRCDVREAESVRAAFAVAVERFGRIDLLFNNAGISSAPATIDEVPLNVWQDVVATNLHGAFLCAREAFSCMRRQNPQGGRIINNGSIASQTPRPLSTPYAMTKHAITGLTKSLAIDGRAFDIACGQIDIGNVLTEMSVPMTQGMLQANGERRAEPVFDLAQVVEAVLYMANLPAEANVPFMTVMATKMPFLGRG